MGTKTMSKKLPDAKKPRQRRTAKDIVEEVLGRPSQNLPSVLTEPTLGRVGTYGRASQNLHKEQTISNRLEKTDYNATVVASSEESLPAVRQRRRRSKRAKGSTNAQTRVGDVIEAQQRQSRLHRLKKAQRASATKKSSDISAAWLTVYEEQKGTMPAVLPSQKELGMFRNNTKKLPPIDLLDFFADVFLLWDELRGGKLNWLKGMPLEPEFGFLARFVQYLNRGIFDLQHGESNRTVEAQQEVRHEQNGTQRTPSVEGTRFFQGVEEPFGDAVVEGDVWLCQEDGTMYVYLQGGWMEMTNEGIEDVIESDGEYEVIPSRPTPAQRQASVPTLAQDELDEEGPEPVPYA